MNRFNYEMVEIKKRDDSLHILLLINITFLIYILKLGVTGNIGTEKDRKDLNKYMELKYLKCPRHF